MTSSWTRSRSHKRNSRASCWELPRNCDPYLDTVAWRKEKQTQFKSLILFIYFFQRMDRLQRETFIKIIFIPFTYSPILFWLLFEFYNLTACTLELKQCQENPKKCLVKIPFLHKLLPQYANLLDCLFTGFNSPSVFAGIAEPPEWADVPWASPQNADQRNPRIANLH